MRETRSPPGDMTRNTKTYIHIGPPKTGTSALQLWLLGNRENLEAQGIYYPEHAKDENQVSSGNISSLFDRPGLGDPVFSPAKHDDLQNRFAASGCHTLLLSSEIFFRQVPRLHEAFPEAIFVAYIRNPLEIAESAYNQMVKRQLQTEPMTADMAASSRHLRRLEEHIDSIGDDKFVLRVFDRELFEGGSLATDFASAIALPLDALSDPDLPIINTSYTFDALEMKRWLNQFPLGAIQRAVDTLLQDYTSGMQRFSFLEPGTFSQLKFEFHQALEKFFTRHDVPHAEVFLHNIAGSDQKPHVRQSLSDEQFSTVCRYLADGNPRLFIRVCDILCSAEALGSDDVRRRDIFRRQSPSGAALLKCRVRLSTRLRRLLRYLRGERLSAYLAASGFTGQEHNVDRLRQEHAMPAELDDGQVLRDLALKAEQDGDFLLALELMEQASGLRQGPLIMRKVAVYRNAVAEKYGYTPAEIRKALRS